MNLVQQKLVCVVGRQAVLALDWEEVLRRYRLSRILNKHLYQLRGRRCCHVRQLNVVFALRCQLVVFAWISVRVEHAVLHEGLKLVPVRLSSLIIQKAKLVLLQLGAFLRSARGACYSWRLFLFIALLEWRGILAVAGTALLAAANTGCNLAKSRIDGRRRKLLLHAHWAWRPVVNRVDLRLQTWILNQAQLVSMAWILWIESGRVTIQRTARSMFKQRCHSLLGGVRPTSEYTSAEMILKIFYRRFWRRNWWFSRPDLNLVAFDLRLAVLLAARLVNNFFVAHVLRWVELFILYDHVSSAKLSRLAR